MRRTACRADGRRLRTVLVTALLPVIGLAFVGCGEKPQVASKSERKADAKGYSGANPVHTVPGWKAGDEASWQQQLKQRAQSQNEHVRVGPQKSGT